jgi:hypothetical protein
MGDHGAQHIELLHADRWKSFDPLSDARAAGSFARGRLYAMAEDKLGAARLRDKFSCGPSLRRG